MPYDWHSPPRSRPKAIRDRPPRGAILKFLHAADLHIDSPLRGLDRLDGAPVDEIRAAPRAAVRRLVDLALAERVDFVVIAGDVFDGRRSDVTPGIFFKAQMERLGDVPAFVARGNHDPAELIGAIPLARNVHLFDEKRPETVRIDRLGVALHGRSFATKTVLEDIAATYPEAVPGAINIGVLHTSLGGYDGHVAYAPTSLDVLRRKGYDAWCLGHVHERKIVSTAPLVLYPGNIQGRHVRECGARGAYVIDDARGELQATFHPLDSIRWAFVRLDVSRYASVDEVLVAATREIAASAAEHPGRTLCIRVELFGATLADGALRAESESLRAELTGGALDARIWIESLRVRTSPAVSLEGMRARDDLIGTLFTALHAARRDGEARMRLANALAPLQAKIPQDIAEAYETRLTDGPGLDAAIAEAEAILLGRIA